MPSQKQELERALTELIADDAKFIATCFKIPNKDKKLVDFIPKPVQLRALRNLKLRNIAVKPSQVGFTSIITALYLKRTMTQANTTTVIVAHNDFLTQRLLFRALNFYKSTPDLLRPELDHKSSYELRFPKINSVMYIGTAQAQVFGRGEPIHNLLFSECAFYPEGAYERIVHPSIERVPASGTVMLESTPNGEGGFFYEEVIKARNRKSVLDLQVYHWWDEPENQLQLDSEMSQQLDLAHELTYTDEELRLAEQWGLSEEQIRWRRWKVLSLGPMFWQEHLESIDTCFITVGQPYYDTRRTLELTKNCVDAPYSFEGTKLWEKPEADSQYVMGVDPGQGRNSQSAAVVLKVVQDAEGYHLRHVGTLAGWHEPAPFGAMCSRLGKFFNTALMVPEANSQGIAFLEAKEVKAYPRKYRRKRMGTARQSISWEWGWYTSGGNKEPLMMRELQRQLPTLETWDAELLHQIRAIRDLGNSKTETVAMDDVHDALTLAMAGMIGYDPTQKRGYRGRSGFEW